MWTPRTEKEIEQWHASTKRDAKFQASIFSGGVWLGLSAILAAGWIAGGKAGLVAQDSVAPASFWSRLPIFLLVGLPVAVWMFRREYKKELARAKYMTICPKCETADENNEGQVCSCGANFVAQSSVRWVEEESKP